MTDRPALFFRSGNACPPDPVFLGAFRRGFPDRLRVPATRPRHSIQRRGVRFFRISEMRCDGKKDKKSPQSFGCGLVHVCFSDIRAFPVFQIFPASLRPLMTRPGTSGISSNLTPVASSTAERMAAGTAQRPVSPIPLMP